MRNNDKYLLKNVKESKTFMSVINIQKNYLKLMQQIVKNSKQ